MHIEQLNDLGGFGCFLRICEFVSYSCWHWKERKRYRNDGEVKKRGFEVLL